MPRRPDTLRRGPGSTLPAAVDCLTGLTLEHDVAHVAHVALLRTERNTTTFRYDAVGHVLGRTMSAPGVELRATQEYDGRGTVPGYSWMALP